MELFTVKWHGPFNLDRSYIPDTANKKGIYMVTRKWGSAHESLKYIGLTKRSLRQRIVEHGWWLSGYRGLIRIRYGIVELQPGQRFSYDRLKDIEALLIYTHKPEENTANYCFYNGRELTVHNTGRRGPLKRIISSIDNGV